MSGSRSGAPGFTTPVEFSPLGTVDLYVGASWSSTVNERTGVMKTTLQAGGVDGSGTAFTVAAVFEQQGLYGTAGWMFDPGSLGSGTVKIVREDGAKAIAVATFSVAGSSYGPSVSMHSGKCLRT